MKKVFVPLFSFLLVLSLLLGTYGSAKAAPGDDPVVTPVSGDTEFTTAVVPIAALPGTVTLDDGMLAPVGFPTGEAQFGSNGIRVSGMDQGKATACFFLSAAAINQGWGGKVGVWNGSKWVLLPTSITTAEESNTATACASIAGNGTYAFIKYVAEPAKLPAEERPAEEEPQLPVCDFDVDLYWDGYTTIVQEGYTQGWMTGATFFTTENLSGVDISLRLYQSIPEGQYVMENTGYGTASAAGPNVYTVVFSSALWWTEYRIPYDTRTYYVTFGECYKILEANIVN